MQLFPEKMEKAFEGNVEAISLLQKSLGISYLDAYVEQIENIVDHFQVRVEDGEPDEATVEQLKTLYAQLQEVTLEPEERRKLSQLLLLKGNSLEPMQANHQLTPDGIGFLFVYLLEQLLDKEVRLLDPAVGMGNLLLTIMTNLQLAKYTVTGIGVDIDETLLAVAAADAEWTEQPVELFHQDGLQDLLIDPVDAVISDLPVGFYPNDQRAQSFKTGVAEGHSYAHHLLMEQGMHYVKPGGYGVFLVPSNLLETEQAPELKKWLAESVFLQGLIQLPDELFKSEQSRKSILLVQNREGGLQKEVLLAQLTSLKDPKVLQQFFKQFEDWSSSNK